MLVVKLGNNTFAKNLCLTVAPTLTADKSISGSGSFLFNLWLFCNRRFNVVLCYNKALREALANCLINADYYGRQGVVIIKRKDSFSFSNPGSFRIDIETEKSGGISDPRNSALIKMFIW